MPARTRLAQLIARQEGFGVPGAIPTLRDNPGDLRHAPHASHVGINPNAIGVEPSDDQGWADLERQILLYASHGMTLRQMISIYAPPNENDSQQYLEFITENLGMSPDDLVSAAVTIPAAVG